ncbi:MAG: PRC-barrel domain-containing protein [Candidatus Aenigmarchaeota archaeon]|nr:PRC-barrel domain-containing protein [Candidatus Aenigmarchaeota archaeon]
MGITVKNVTEMMGKDVFTNKGSFCGKIVDVEVDLTKFRLNSLVIEASRGSFLANVVGGKKGVIVPYRLVDNVGDVVIIKHITPTMPEESAPAEEGTESTGIMGF